MTRYLDRNGPRTFRTTIVYNSSLKNQSTEVLIDGGTIS